MVASGNDFVVIESGVRRLELGSLNSLAKRMCESKLGIGADGLLVLLPSKAADIKMRIFNADGSEAEMCGNGARCTALFKSKVKNKKAKIKIETKAGIIASETNGENVKVRLTDPKGLKLDIPLKLNNRSLRVNFINTGVPHVVIFVQGLDNIDVVGIGRRVRYHRRFFPAGTNVNFIEVLDRDLIKIRTYERGVESETFACGTGSAAAALISGLKLKNITGKINVLTKSGEALKVYFDKEKNKFSNVWLEGKARLVYKGEYYV